ncbi:MAG: hypothetical protein ACLPQ6_05330 [Steroidobacteraceae bacterium]|jgi:hypothetical protein
MTEKPQAEQSLDSRLDEALEMTFPASDPVAVHSPDPRSTRPPRTEESSLGDPVSET